MGEGHPPRWAWWQWVEFVGADMLFLGYCATVVTLIPAHPWWLSVWMLVVSILTIHIFTWFIPWARAARKIRQSL